MGQEGQLVQYHNMIQRLHRLAKYASESSVRIMIDAEQSYMQPAIDHLVLMLQRQYNHKTVTPHPIIYSTYQCYLKDSYHRVLEDLHRAKREGFHFACKLVRGAYMVQERKRAKELMYTDPIHNTLKDTHWNYNRLIYLLLQHNNDAKFMVASHNAESVMKTVEWMDELNIRPSGSGVSFGQLYGMCDQISYTLGKGGYEVYKYVPYGPVEEVVPYLGRRAEENMGMMGKAQEERRLVQREILNQFSL